MAPRSVRDLDVGNRARPREERVHVLAVSSEVIEIREKSDPLAGVIA